MLFREDELPAVTGELTWGSLSKAISGTGVTQAADSVTYSLPSMEAQVTGWYVSAGDMVEAGTLLFEQDDAEVDELIEDYRDEILENEDNILNYEVEIENCQAEIRQLQEDLEEAWDDMEKLTITAPFSGRITGLAVEEDDEVSSGRGLATLTDTSALEITQYFSSSRQ